MNDEKDEFVNTEKPLEVSEELLKELMEASAQIDRGEGLVSHEEMEKFFDTLLDDYSVPPSNQHAIKIKEKGIQKVGNVNEI